MSADSLIDDVYDAFDALMRELEPLTGLAPTARVRRQRKQLLQRHIEQTKERSALVSWARFLQPLLEEVGAGGDAGLLQQAIALADEHPVTLAAERWLRDVGFKRAWLRQLNRPSGMGPPRPRVEWTTHARDAVTASRDGQTVVTADGNRVAVYDVKTGALRTSFKTRFSEGFRKMVIHPDGRRLIIGLGINDDHVRVYDLETGRKIRRFVAESDTQNFALAPNGRHFIGSDESLHLWDLETKREKPIWSATVRSRYFDPEMSSTGDWYDCIDGNVTPLIDPEGSWCVVRAGAKLEFRSLRDGAVVREIPLTFEDAASPEASTDECALLRDGKRGLWVTADRRSVVQVLDLESGDRTAVLQELRHPISALAVAPRGTRFAGAAKDGTVSVWDAESLQCIWLVRAHHGEATGLAFIDDDNLVTTGTDGVARIWAIDERATSPRNARSLCDDVLARKATPDGRHLFCFHEDGFLRKWRIATGKCVRRFDAAGIPHNGRFGIWMAPDGGYALLTRDTWSETLEPLKPSPHAAVFRFDLKTGTHHLLYESDRPTLGGIVPASDGTLYVATDRNIARIKVSSSGRIAKRQISGRGMTWSEVVADRWLVSSKSNLLEVFDIENPSAGPQRVAYVYPPLAFTTMRVRIESDHVLLALASNDTVVWLVRLPDGKVLRKFGKARDAEMDPAGVTYSPDGRLVYGASEDHDLFEWEIQGRASRSWTLPDGPTQGLAMHPSIGQDIVAQTSASVLVLDPSDGHIVARHGYPAASSLDGESNMTIDDSSIALAIDRRILFLRINRTAIES